MIVLQLGKLDLTSPASKMMLTMPAAVGEMERDLLVGKREFLRTWRKAGKDRNTASTYGGGHLCKRIGMTQSYVCW